MRRAILSRKLPACLPQNLLTGTEDPEQIKLLLWRAHHAAADLRYFCRYLFSGAYIHPDERILSEIGIHYEFEGNLIRIFSPRSVWATINVI